MTHQDNVRRGKALFERFGITETESATLGAVVDGVPQIAVRGKYDEVYVTLGDGRSWTTVKRGAANLADTFGKRVRIGRVAGNSYREILNPDYERHDPDTGGGGRAQTSGATPHAHQHQMGVNWRSQPTTDTVSDPVFLPSRQIADLLLVPYSEMQVAVLAGEAVVDDTRLRFGGGVLPDMTAEVPANAGEAVIARVELDSSGALQVSYGSAYDEPVTDTAALGHAPAATAGRNTLGFVWLPYGVTTLTWQHLLPAPLSERTGGANSGSGGAGDFLDLTDTPASYSGQASKLVAVNAGATGLEFVAPSNGASYNALLPVPVYSETLSSADTFDTGSNGIPANGRDLELTLSVRGAASEPMVILNIYLNGDTTVTNYRRIRVGGNGTAVSTNAGDVAGQIGIVGDAAPPSTFSPVKIWIPDYANTSRHKHMLVFTGQRDGATAQQVNIYSVWWESTAAIHQITVEVDDATDTLVAGSSLNIVAHTELTVGAASRATYSDDSVSDPPTDAELDSAFGAPATLGAGFIGLLDDDGADTDVYLVATNGTSWFFTALTKAT